jgi:hypothetical protein
METPLMFNLPGASFTFMAAGEKWPPIIPAKGWQLLENGHTFEETLSYNGNVGFRAGNGYIGLDLDNPAAFKGLVLPPTTTWETRPGRYGKLFTGTVPPELMEKYGKPANHSQFKLYKWDKVVGEIKLERCYQVIPCSWKTLDDGTVAHYTMVDSIPPAPIDLAVLMADVLSLPGVSLVQFPKSDTATRHIEAIESPVATSPERALAYARAALLRELAATETAPESTRYDQGYKSGCALGELVAAGLLPFEATKAALIEASIKSGLTRFKATETVSNGMNKTKCKPRKIPEQLTPHISPGNPGHNPDGWFDGQFYGVKEEPKVHELTEEEFKAYRMPDGPKFSINLPPDNWLSRYAAYGDEISDAYPDYWTAGGLFALAVLSDKKIRIELDQGIIYPNIYVSMNGKSSLARKSTVVNKTEDVLIAVRREIIRDRVPTEFSPEAFTEHMSNHQHAPWIRDEAAGVLALMKRDYMKGFKDCLTSLYDCKPYERMLRTSQRKDKQTTFIVDDPFLNLLWATTDASFAANTELNDTLSGFLARFLFFFPQGMKAKFMPLREGTGKTSAFETVIIDQLRQIYEKLQSMESTVMHLAPEAADYWEKWQKIREDEAIATNDGAAMQIFSRSNPTVAKLVMLFELGQPGFDANHPIRLSFVVEACRFIDEYLMPTARAMYDLVGSNAEKNVIDRIMGYLKSHNGKATKNEIMRAVKIMAREMNDYISTMLECHMIRTEVYKAHGKGRDSVWLFIDEETNVDKIAKIAIIPKVAKVEDIPESVEGVPSTLELLVSLDTLHTQGCSGVARVECKDANIPAKSSPEVDRIREGHKAYIGKKKRTCHICERTFDYDLTPDQSYHSLVGCYLCTTCLMEHRTREKPAPIETITQTKLSEVA